MRQLVAEPPVTGVADSDVVDAGHPQPREPPTPLLAAHDLAVAFGGICALDGARLEVAEGSICGLIGPNGAGKTTLFNCVTRLCTPIAGTIRFAGHDLLETPRHRVVALGIARTFQNLGLFESLSVRDNVALGGLHRARASFLGGTLRLPGATRERRDLLASADAVLDRLGLGDLADRPATGLPYGTLKRIELARALAARPRLLLLDEPANGLSQTEVGELAELIAQLRAEHELTILLVEHHMGLVMELCERVVVLERGRTIAAGPPAAVQADPAVVEAYLGVGA